MNRHLTFHPLGLFDEATVAIGCLVFAGKYNNYRVRIDAYINQYFKITYCPFPLSKCFLFNREEIVDMENMILPTSVMHLKIMNQNKLSIVVAHRLYIHEGL